MLHKEQIAIKDIKTSVWRSYTYPEFMLPEFLKSLTRASLSLRGTVSYRHFFVFSRIL